ncbi:MAG TPA: thiamine-phosphate kinase, partial [Mycobacterium sp.]|nr:thiamine-phosphate kinase [Mycobacterium sp.]
MRDDSSGAPEQSPTLQQLGEFAVIDRLVRGRRQPAA